ncbi:tripartite motif-containing protein 56 [Mytilus galloprovincialis]|uniref:Tripartite motif-containing protein 56 n=2 Tax=Mytilus galloprovincialis TaxID=29158 RepID=A0A8B6HTV8_MYTGA|nr:tripartite motif-containing protein 56 [Mytilus galloprovincialis]
MIVMTYKQVVYFYLFIDIETMKFNNKYKMATSADAKEGSIKEDFADLLTCTICLETFKQPKYLPCLHTFCETCINTYIVSTVKEEKPEGFKCPVCRRLVCCGNSAETPNTWARNLPGNHFVNSMIDRRAMQKAEKLCDACSNENVSQKAISWCIVCDEAYCGPCEVSHKRFKITRSHNLVAITDINAEINAASIFASVACDEHPDKTIEIYCKDHSKPCCTVCATVHHRKCEHVVTIDKAVAGVKESTKAKELMKKLKETVDKLEAVINTRKQNTTNFEAEIDAVLVEIGDVREKLNKKLNDLEKRIREEVNSTRKNNVLRLSEESAELLSLKSTFNQWKNVFGACLSHGSDIQCLVKMEEISSKLPQIEHDLSKAIQGIKDIHIKFEATDVIADTACFGRLQFKEQKPSLPGLKTVNYHTGKIKVMFTIDIKGSYISGIFFNDDIIITDYDKNRIVYHDNNGNQTGVLNIPNHPTDITKVNDRTVAVSSDAQKIFIIYVKPLTLTKTLDTKVPTWGLCLVENEYITAYSNTIYWLNAETGAKIKELATGADTRFVTCYKTNKYVYMKNSNCVKLESPDGKGFQYNNSKLSYSYNQEIDEDGNIYVVGHSSRNIHQLTPTGQLIRIIPLSDIDNTITMYPWVMRFKRNTNRFLLTFQATGVPVLVCEIE